MDAAVLLDDAISRVSEQVPAVLGGLGEDDLAWQPSEGSNSIAWLIWHLTRVADEYSAGLTGAPSRWSEGWCERFALPYPPDAHGYGQTADEVAQMRASAENLLGYYEEVEPVLRGYLGTLTPEALDEIIDRSWDPPVTLGARLVSIVDDGAQHIGQAAYLRGMLERR